MRNRIDPPADTRTIEQFMRDLGREMGMKQKEIDDDMLELVAFCGTRTFKLPITSELGQQLKEKILALFSMTDEQRRASQQQEADDLLKHNSLS
jgi:hypothetical protein